MSPFLPALFLISAIIKNHACIDSTDASKNAILLQYSAVFRLHLQPSVNSHQRALLDLEFALNGINEEWKPAPAVSIDIRRASYLALVQLDAHFGKYLPGLREIDVAWRVHDRGPYSL
jgi:hypothetical protein